MGTKKKNTPNEEPTRKIELPTEDSPDAQVEIESGMLPIDPLDLEQQQRSSDAPRSARQTITNEVELEAARLRSVALESKPPKQAAAQRSPSLLSLANANAPTMPPPTVKKTGDPPPQSQTQPSPTIQDKQQDSDLVEMKDRYSLGDYSGALQIAEGILADDAEHAEAARCAEQCREVLIKMYAARIGPLDRVPLVMVPRNQLRWLTIDHRAGFVLSHVDGTSTLEMILDVSGMPRLDTLRIMYELVQQRIISFK